MKRPRKPNREYVAEAMGGVGFFLALFLGLALFVGTVIGGARLVEAAQCP